jgi:YVTN family beta-propeller protein
MPAGASPRYLVIAGSKGFVTALFKNLVYVVDMNSFTIIDSVAVGANPEEIIVHQNKIYVANSGFGNGNTVTVISATNLNPVKTITVGDNPQFLRVDGIGNIHVLCGGAYNDFNDPNDDTPGGIWLVDPSTDTVVDSLVLPAGTHPSDLAIGSGEVGYFINGSAIASYNTMTLALMNSTLINGFFYAMNINTKTNELFVTDAKDFVSPGELIIFDTNGVEKARYTTGVIPGHVTFLGY